MNIRDKVKQVREQILAKRPDLDRWLRLAAVGDYGTLLVAFDLKLIAREELDDLSVALTKADVAEMLARAGLA